MSDRNPRVLIGLSSDIFFRNFVETRAFEALAERFELFWFVTDAVKRALPIRPGVTDAGRSSANPWHDRVRYHMRWVAVFAGHRRCKTLAIKRRHSITSRRERWPYTLLSLPGIWPVADRAVEAFFGVNRSIERIVEQVQPDVILFPSQGNDPVALDLLRAAQSRGIATVMLNYNWDNMGSKGPMRFKPERLCVWGEDMARLAQQVHELDPEQIKVIGAAQFEQYFDRAHMACAESRSQERLPRAPRVLFAGNSRGHPEAKYLLMLEEAIEAGRLPSMSVIYRPHPWRSPRVDETHFQASSFRHVEMDPQLADHFGGELNAASKKPDRTFAPSMAYNAQLLRSVNGVITPLSTLALEAALVGVPVLGMNCFDDEVFKNALDQFEHLQRVQSIPGVLVCRDERRFIEDVGRLLALGADPALPARMREAVRPIVYSDGGRTTYAERLADVVAELLGQPRRTEPAHERTSPVPALAEDA